MSLKFKIINKLEEFLHKNITFEEECRVIYTLVEIRKILDHENNLKYPILRFYCNWSVHINKYTTEEMKLFMQTLYKEVKNEIENQFPPSQSNKIFALMYMTDLKKELLEFLKEYNLPKDSFKNEEIWIEFIKLLTGILAVQPIKNPCEEITQFSFFQCQPNCVKGRIDFKEPIGKYPGYKFTNYY